jgi:hypothetical protein
MRRIQRIDANKEEGIGFYRILQSVLSVQIGSIRRRIAVTFYQLFRFLALSVHVRFILKIRVPFPLFPHFSLENASILL